MNDGSDDDLQLVFASGNYADVNNESYPSRFATGNQRDAPTSHSLITVVGDSEVAHGSRYNPQADDTLGRMIDEYIGLCGDAAETQKVLHEDCATHAAPDASALNLDAAHHRRDYLSPPSYDHMVFGTEEKLEPWCPTDEEKLDGDIICVIGSGSEGEEPVQKPTMPAFGVHAKRRTSMKKAIVSSIPKPKAKKKRSVVPTLDDQKKPMGRPKMSDQQRIDHLQKLLQKETMARFRMKQKTHSKEAMREDDQLWMDLVGIGDNPLRGKK